MTEIKRTRLAEEEKFIWGTGFPDYTRWNYWTESDFEKYQKWCIWHFKKGNMLFRECGHLHCHPDKCIIRARVELARICLVDNTIFPKEICKMIADMIPEEDKIW